MQTYAACDLPYRSWTFRWTVLTPLIFAGELPKIESVAIRTSPAPSVLERAFATLREAVAEHAGAKWPALLTFLVTLAIFLLNIAPGVSFHDSGEFSLALHSGGIPHPPGAPTWMLLTTGLKFLLPGVAAARVANIFSALCGAVTLALLYIFVYRLSLHLPNRSRHYAATTAVVALASCGAYLEQSFIAEQYTLLTALLLVNLLAVQSTIGKPKPWKIVTIGALWAVSCGNHPSQLVLGLLMVAVVIQVRKEIPVWKSVPLGLVGFALGALVFLWLPFAASHHPILSWGKPDSWAGFWWCITRQQWETRPISSAPVGMVPEWLLSYDLVGQLGALTVVLALASIPLWKSEFKKPLVWILLGVVPYCAVLLIGHLRQQLMDLQYIRYYGVIDWHLPLYLGLAIFAGITVAYWSSKMPAKAWPMFAGCLCVIGAGGVRQLENQSLKSFDAAKNYVDYHFKSLPQNAILVMFSDDVSHMMAYTRYGLGTRPDTYVAYGMIQKDYADPKTPWNAGELVKYLQGKLLDRTLQPLNLARLTSQEILSRPIVTEYTPDAPRFASMMIPYGMLFLMRDRPVSDADVRSAEQYSRATFPEMFEPPVGVQHRLTREAYALTHIRRALYFIARGQYDLAKPAAELAAAWQPENTSAHFALGLISDQGRDYVGAEKEYKKAMELIPDQPGPRQNLAILYAVAGRFDEALRLAREELRLRRGAPEIAGLIRTIEANRLKTKG